MSKGEPMNVSWLIIGLVGLVGVVFLVLGFEGYRVKDLVKKYNESPTRLRFSWEFKPGITEGSLRVPQGTVVKITPFQYPCCPETLDARLLVKVTAFEELKPVEEIGQITEECGTGLSIYFFARYPGSCEVILTLVDNKGKKLDTVSSGKFVNYSSYTIHVE